MRPNNLFPENLTSRQLSRIPADFQHLYSPHSRITLHNMNFNGGWPEKKCVDLTLSGGCNNVLFYGTLLVRCFGEGSITYFRLPHEKFALEKVLERNRGRGLFSRLRRDDKRRLITFFKAFVFAKRERERGRRNGNLSPRSSPFFIRLNEKILSTFLVVRLRCYHLVLLTSPQN